MIDEFTKTYMESLMAEMKAVSGDAKPDHKTRVTALKEARAFLKEVLPRLSVQEKNALTTIISDQVQKAMKEHAILFAPQGKPAGLHESDSGIRSGECGGARDADQAPSDVPTDVTG